LCWQCARGSVFSSYADRASHLASVAPFIPTTTALAASFPLDLDDGWLSTVPVPNLTGDIAMASEGLSHFASLPTLLFAAPLSVIIVTSSRADFGVIGRIGHFSEFFAASFVCTSTSSTCFSIGCECPCCCDNCCCCFCNRFCFKTYSW